MHIELDLICSIVCALCHAMPYLNGHASYLIVHHAMFMLVGLPCCLLLSGLRLSLASVSFRSCEDSFDYVRLSSSWTRSSSLLDLRQDDHYPRYHFYLCFSCSLYRYDALPTTCLSCLPYCHAKPLTFSPFLANRCLAMLPLLLSPSYSVASCR